MRLSRAAYAKFCAGLPGVTLHEQWESLVAKVGGKVFALRGEAAGGIVFKVSELAFEGLTSLEGIGQAAYFARGQWVNVSRGADLSLRDLKAYIAQSHRIVAAKLTRRARAELGLD
jgi:predicted DNA-binding protein (MmcQ/YjbR family)